MPYELQPLNRRNFLRLTGAGTAATAISSLLPHALFAQAGETPLTDRPTPKNPVILRCGEAE